MVLGAQAVPSVNLGRTWGINPVLSTLKIPCKAELESSLN